MNHNKKLIILSLVIAVAFLAISCGEKEPEPAKETTLNLIDFYDVARQEIETGVFDINSVRSSYFFAGGGWAAPYPDPELGEDVIMAVRRSSRLRYQVIEPSDRWFVFKVAAMGSLGGVNKQTLEISIDGKKLATVDFEGNKLVEHKVFIPKGLQHRGNNLIDFKFMNFDKNPKYELSKNKRRKFPYRGIAAHFADLKIVFGNEEKPLENGAWTEEQVFEPSANGENLRQRPYSRITYAFDGMQNAKISFAGRIDAPGQEESLRLELETRSNVNSTWHKVWEKIVTLPASAEELTIDEEYVLDYLEDTMCEFRFSVDSDTQFSKSSVIWQKIELELPHPLDTKTAERKPIRAPKKIENVIILVCDAFRADLMGVIGGGSHTPNMSKVAQEGIVFRNAVAAAPYTVASISSLFSSLIPDAHGVRRGRSLFPDHLDTMGGSFTRANYHTLVLAGLPFIKRKFGITRDCLEEVYLRAEEDRDLEISRMDIDLIKSSIDEAIASEKSIFVYTHLLPPHWPYNPPPPFGDPTKTTAKKLNADRRKLRQDLANGKVSQESSRMVEHFDSYKVNLEYADYIVGEMLAYLKQQGLDKNTMLVLAADHGEAFGEHDSLGHSSTVYDEMIHVPIIVHYPGVEHRIIDQQVGLIDIYPTMMELMNLETESDFLYGRSLAPLFTGGDQEPADYYYSRAVDYTTSLKIDKTEYVHVRTRFMLRGEKYKYIFSNWSDQLFDLENDPDELMEISDQFPALTTALRQRGLAMIKHAHMINAGRTQEADIAEDEEELKNLGYLN